MLKEDRDPYTINELAKKAQVSVRTIRYYIDEGLLPAPETRGRYTVYTEEYLDRLELIRRLKDSFLPLKEIRATLESLTWEEVQTSLADLRKKDEEAQRAQMETEPQARAKEVRSTALEYITDLLSSAPVKRPLPPQPPAWSPADKLGGRLDAGQGTWQRIDLGSGVELHILHPIPPNRRAQVEELIRLAKKLFSS